MHFLLLGSQSLWNRAMSFDVEYQGVIKERLSQSLWNRAMSFDTLIVERLAADLGLNPFGTGQCLSTSKTI